MSDQVKYGHGGRVFALARQLNLDPADILDFSASINPLGPPPQVRAAVMDELDLLLTNYPEVEAGGLASIWAERLGLAADHLAVANGSTEPIHLLPHLAADLADAGRALIVAPAFSEYAAGLDKAGWRIDRYCAPAEAGFKPDFDKLLDEARSGYGLIFIGQPGNPHGGAVEPDLLARLAEAVKPQSGLVVVDEAFIDFCPDQTIVPRLADLPSLVVLRSQTKFYALPGLRLGALLARPGIIDRFRALQPPWSVNALAQRAGAAILDLPDGPDGYARRTRRLIDAQREIMANRLQALGLTVFPSAVNYLLVRTEPNQPGVAQIQDRLAAQRILIRDCANFAGLGPGYFRVAIKNAEANQRLAEALAAALT